MQAQPKIRIGSRGSPLALVQAEEVRRRLLQAHADLAPEDVAILPIRTTGDRIKDKPLREFGGKGLFTKEIEQALHDGEIDLAVHSMKDMPTVLPAGLVVDCFLPREDPRDAFISAKAADIAALPQGAVVGSASLRRQAQLRNRRPDLQVVPLRGNVQTRLAKLAAGEMDATLLAMAGLARLGMLEAATAPVPAETMLPAVCQGVIGVERRARDGASEALLAPLNDPQTAACAAAERALLAVLDGSCRTPFAGLATLSNGRLRLRGQVLSPDGAQNFLTEHSGPVADAQVIGQQAGDELRRRAGPAFWAALGV